MAFAFKSSRSKLPSRSDLTGTTFNPAITADYTKSQHREHSFTNITYSRVRPMGTDGNKTDVTVALTTRLVVCPDDRKTSIFTSSS